MPAKFYVALKGTEASVHAAWEECKQLQKKQGGYTFRSFTSSKDAVDWVTSKGGSLNEEDIPSYILSSEPILSKPVLIAHKYADAEKGKVLIYSDGSCLSNPGGPGGFGSVIFFPNGDEILLSGREAVTTNNRMEIMGAITALDYVGQHLSHKEIDSISIMTDSRYVKDIFEKNWIQGWKKNGWKKVDGEAVSNRDLLEILDWFVSKYPVTFVWVKSHNGDTYNEMADRIALKEAVQAAKDCKFPFHISKKDDVTNDSHVTDTKKKDIVTEPSVVKSKSVTKGFVPFSKKESKKKRDSASPMLLTRRTSPLLISKKKAGKKALRPKGNLVKKSCIKVELHNGQVLTIPISPKQSDIINLILGVQAQDGFSRIKVFDDATLQRILESAENPLFTLLKEYKRPFYR